MRELKFRVWNTIDRKMLKWGDIFHLPAWEIFPGTPEQRAFDIMQYTGLRDKNGVEIYEGDIVKHGLWKYEVKRNIGFIMSCLYGAGGTFQLSDGWKEHLEVLGNIYENSELLKDDKC